MFAKSIVLSDAFLDMPASTRCLYFTLGMLADDEGFVGSPKSIMRQCGASQDDMALLLQKRYLLGFGSGVVVIKHWRINNYLQNDRVNPTTYQEELSMLMLDSKKAYTEKEKIVPENQMYTECIHSIEENSIEEISIDKKVRHKYGQYKNVLLSDEDMEKLKNEFPDYEVRIERLSEYMESSGKKYKNHLATIRSWARKDKPQQLTGTSYDSDAYKRKAREMPIVYKRKEINEEERIV